MELVGSSRASRSWAHAIRARKRPLRAQEATPGDTTQHKGKAKRDPPTPTSSEESTALQQKGSFRVFEFVFSELFRKMEQIQKSDTTKKGHSENKNDLSETKPTVQVKTRLRTSTESTRGYSQMERRCRTAIAGQEGFMVHMEKLQSQRPTGGDGTDGTGRMGRPLIRLGGCQG